MAEKKTPLPSPGDLLLGTPLYESFIANASEISGIRNFRGPIDCYCTRCKKDATFRSHAAAQTARLERMVSPSVNDRVQTNPCSEAGSFEVQLVCTRCDVTYYFFFGVSFLPPKSTGEEIPPLISRIQKIGQIPSFSDLNCHGLSKYRSILGPKYAELTKAVHSASHGFGIAAYAYLRRVFEYLVEEARKRAAGDEGWDDQAFEGMVMNKKIAALKQHLPAFLVQKAEMYSILSTGIHQLTEDDCLKYFPVIKCGIELILDQQLERIEREKKERAAQVEIQRIHQELA